MLYRDFGNEDAGTLYLAYFTLAVTLLNDTPDWVLCKPLAGT